MYSPIKRKIYQKWYRNHRNEKIDKARKYRESDRGKLTKRIHSLKKNFGLSLEDYSKMFDEQNGKCKICNKTQDYKLLAVDHCHSTGEIRGLLCNNCNVALGLLQEQESIIQSMISYLKKRLPK